MMPGGAVWAGRQAAMVKPLEACPHFPEVAERWEAWWRFEADRPLLVTAIGVRTGIRWDKCFDLLEKPDEWLAARRLQLEGLRWSRDIAPSIRVDLGPVVTGAFLGAPLHFAAGENTSWQTPVIEAWTEAAVPRLDPQNRWLRTVRALLERTARDAAGRYLVCLPDYGGAFDILANLRGAENLLLDLYDQPERLAPAATRAVDAWETAFATAYETVTAAGAGVTSWLHAWSAVPYTLPTCDFNYMIGEEMFREQVLPSLAEQARRAGRCLFHIDGPGAAKHAEALAGEPALTALQYTPGAGTPSALERLPMLKRLQAAGKPLVVCCPAAEAGALAAALDPRGLALIPEGVRTPDDLARLEARIGR